MATNKVRRSHDVSWNVAVGGIIFCTLVQESLPDKMPWADLCRQPCDFRGKGIQGKEKQAQSLWAHMNRSRGVGVSKHGGPPLQMQSSFKCHIWPFPWERKPYVGFTCVPRNMFWINAFKFILERTYLFKAINQLAIFFQNQLYLFHSQSQFYYWCPNSACRGRPLSSSLLSQYQCLFSGAAVATNRAAWYSERAWVWSQRDQKHRSWGRHLLMRPWPRHAMPSSKPQIFIYKSRQCLLERMWRRSNHIAFANT